MTRQLSSSSTRESTASSRESDSHHSRLATTEASAVQGIFRAGLADAETVRTMQGTIGNQAVQRELLSYTSGGTADTSPIQRSSTYASLVAAKPPRLNLAIGDNDMVSFTVTNGRQAPKGTRFTWHEPTTVFKGAGPPIETLATDDTQEQGRKQTLWLQAKAPGTATYEAKLQTDVPGEEEALTEGAKIEVDVPRPYITDSSWDIRTPDGSKRTSPDRLRIGDEYVTRLTFSGVSKTQTDHQAGSSIQMPGPDVIEPTELTWEKPDVFRMTFRAIAIGHGVAKVRVPIGNTPQAQRPEYLVDTHVEMGTQEFLNKTGQVNTLIDAADRRATAWLASVSNAYATAWNRHTGALKDQADLERLTGDLILGAALAFVPGGVGGLVGAKMRALEHGEFMIDGMKDLAKHGLRGPGAIASQAATAPTGGSGLTAYPTDPRQWQNQETIRIKTELAEATERLLDWQRRANANDPNFYADFDPVQAMADSLTVSDSSGKKQPAAELRPVDEGTLADQFEKGFWKTWLEMFGWTVVQKTGFFGLSHHEAADNVGKKIRDRCEALGLPIDKYMEASRQQKLKEATDLNQQKLDKILGRNNDTN